jgi:hypothetical protein
MIFGFVCKHICLSDAGSRDEFSCCKLKHFLRLIVYYFRGERLDFRLSGNDVVLTETGGKSNFTSMPVSSLLRACALQLVLRVAILLALGFIS